MPNTVLAILVATSGCQFVIAGIIFNFLSSPYPRIWTGDLWPTDTTLLANLLSSFLPSSSPGGNSKIRDFTWWVSQKATAGGPGSGGWSCPTPLCLSEEAVTQRPTGVIRLQCSGRRPTPLLSSASRHCCISWNETEASAESFPYVSLLGLP